MAMFIYLRAFSVMNHWATFLRHSRNVCNSIYDNKWLNEKIYTQASCVCFFFFLLFFFKEEHLSTGPTTTPPTETQLHMSSHFFLQRVYLALVVYDTCFKTEVTSARTDKTVSFTDLIEWYYLNTYPII